MGHISLPFWHAAFLIFCFNKLLTSLRGLMRAASSKRMCLVSNPSACEFVLVSASFLVSVLCCVTNNDAGDKKNLIKKCVSGREEVRGK